MLLLVKSTLYRIWPSRNFHVHLSVLSRNPTVKGGEEPPSLGANIHMDKQLIPVFTMLKVRLRVKR